MVQHIDELIGVYDADSTLWGEMTYWIGARVGRAHCSLCELTHGMFTKKSAWKQCESSMGLPFHTYHRNDAPAEILEIAQGHFPVVLARSSDTLSIALTPEELDAFHGSIALFEQWLDTYLA